MTTQLAQLLGSVTWMALWKQGCAGTVLTEPQEEESVWAEPVDEGLLS